MSAKDGTIWKRVLEYEAQFASSLCRLSSRTDQAAVPGTGSRPAISPSARSGEPLGDQSRMKRHPSFRASSVLRLASSGR